jgi:hypothetical protein
MPTLTGPIVADGSLVNILVGVSEARRQTLRSVGFPVPSPSPVRVLLDTGSFITIAVEQAIVPLGVTRYDQRPFFNSSVGMTPIARDVFNLSITLLDDKGVQLYYWPSVDVIPGVFPPTDQVQGIIGRDLLDDCVFIYDGKRRNFTLDI